MEFYADVLSGATKQGSGPVTAIAGCSVTRRVDAAGAWSMRVSAADTQASQLQIRRSVKIYAYIVDTWTEIGGGIIDNIAREVDADGSEWLVVSGADQLRELANLSTVQLLLAADDVLGEWTQLAYLGRESVRSLCRIPDTSIILAGTSSDVTGLEGAHIYRSTDNGNTWALVYEASSTSGHEIACFVALTAGIVLAGGTSGVYRSVDDGNSWVSVSATAAYSLANLGGGNILFGGATGSVYKSTDYGATWDGGTATGAGSYVIQDLLFLGSGIVVAATSANKIMYSGDSGATWSTKTWTALASGAVTYALTSPTTNVVLACTDAGGVTKSTDNGSTWGTEVDIDGGASAGARWIATWNGYVVVAAGDKIYYSSGPGYTTFTECGDLGTTTIYALLGLDNSMLAGEDVSAGIWRGVTLQVGVTHAAAVQALEDLASGWTFTADASPPIDDILIQFAGESVLTGALMVAERSGTHCYLSATDTLTFTDAWTDSGIHATNNLRGNGDLDATVAALLELTVEQSSYDLVTRVYPFGKRADGATLFGIGSATATATGYTKDTTAGWVQNTAGEAAYGVIERMVVFPDIVLPAAADVTLPVFDTSPTAETEVGNALVRAAVTYLERTSQPVTNYRLKLGGLSDLLWPMDSLRVTYVGDTIVDDTLYIMEATWRGDGDGLVTSELIAASEKILIETDAQILARAVQRVDAVAAR